MTAVLPRGLVNANPTVQQHAIDDSNVNFTNADALRKFWKVYAVQSDATHDGTAIRSRNLFWRVWSNRPLTKAMSSARLMRLWQRCSQDFDMTPIGDNLILPPVSGLQDLPARRQIRNRSSSLSPSSEIRPTADSSPRGGQNTGPALQDFKWSPTGPQIRGDRPRIQLRGAGDSDQQRLDSTSGSTSQTTSESSSRPTLSRTVSGGRQRQSVLATAGKARTRPQISRRKSSSQKSGGPSQPKSPRLPPNNSPPARNAQEVFDTMDRLAAKGPPPGLPVPTATSGPAFALPPASSWQSVESTSPNPPLATTAPVQSTTSGDLVDPDFRGKFVETQKKLASSTNLAGLGRMRRPGSIVRFADEIPREELSKGKERDEPISPQREEHLGPSRLRTSMASEAISDSSDSDSSSGNMELPRSKSQLSLLIKNKRSETGSSDLGPPQTQETKAKESDAREKAKSKEQELLSMGRRDGVTKAGGIQVPKQQRVSELDDPGSLSPSSPEPLF